MINSMQAMYIRLLRKIKQKADGESPIAKDLVYEGTQKLLNKFPDATGIVEATRKLYSTAIKTYKQPNALIQEVAEQGADLLFSTFGAKACTEILNIFGSAIVQYFQLKADPFAHSVAEAATNFFNYAGCPKQVPKVTEVLNDPKSKSEFKLF